MIIDRKLSQTWRIWILKTFRNFTTSWCLLKGYAYDDCTVAASNIVLVIVVVALQYLCFYDFVCSVFTARRLAKRGICRRRVSVCVCLSHSSIVSKRLNVGSRKQRRTIAPSLVFWRQRSWRNSNGITPYVGDKCRWGGLKLISFDEKRAITQKRYKIDV